MQFTVCIGKAIARYCALKDSMAQQFEIVLFIMQIKLNVTVRKANKNRFNCEFLERFNR